MGRWDNRTVAFSGLVGKTLTSIEGMEQGSETVSFKTSDGLEYRLTYYQDCCASCSIADVTGDVADLIGHPILAAEETSNADGPEPEYPESWTWTFYNMRTVKGAVNLRWLGESNGYYSEEATFELVGVTEE